MTDVALVTLLRDANVDDLREWVAYHLLRGVGYIRIYDHARADGNSGNLDALRLGLSTWCSAGQVEIRTRVSEDACVLSEDSDEGLVCKPDQFSARAAYLDAMFILQGRTRWAAFIDYDEFIDDGTELPLVHALDQLAQPDTGAVTIEMRRYGASGHYLRPRDLVTSSYRWREKHFALNSVRSQEQRSRLHDQGNFRKSVVRPEALLRPYFGTHSWVLRDGWHRIDAGREQLVLHHYFTKSAEEYLDKFMLGTHLGHPGHQNWSTFNRLSPGDDSGTALDEHFELTEDTTMFRFRERIQAELLRSV